MTTDKDQRIAELERDAELQRVGIDAQTKEWQSEVTRLTDALASAREDTGNARVGIQKQAERAEAAEARVRELEESMTYRTSLVGRLESECAALRAEVERLNRVSAIDQERIAVTLAEVERLNDRVRIEVQTRADWVAAKEQQLAAANALLESIREEIRVCETEAERRDPEDEHHIQADGYRHIRAHLSAQPATALQRSIDAAGRDVPAWRREAAAADFPISAKPATAPTKDRHGVPRARFVVGVDGLARAQSQPATAPDYDPITAPVPPGDMNGPHGELPKPTAPTRTEGTKKRSGV